MENAERVAVWPDGTWCPDKDIESGFVFNRSDDFIRAWLPYSVRDVDAWAYDVANGRVEVKTW